MSDLIEIEMPRASSKRIAEFTVGSFFIYDGMLCMLHSVNNGRHFVISMTDGVVFDARHEEFVVGVRVKIIASHL